MHPRIWLAARLLAARAHCWLKLSSPSIKTPRSLSAHLHSIFSSLNLYVHPGLHCPSCRIWYLSLLNFIQLVIVEHSNLSGSPCKDPLPSRESTAPPNSVSIGKLTFRAFDFFIQVIDRNTEENWHLNWASPTLQPLVHPSYFGWDTSEQLSVKDDKNFFENSYFLWEFFHSSRG